MDKENISSIEIEKPDPYAALRVPEFRNFTVSRLCITIAAQMQAVLVGWQVYEITKDPLSLGLIGLAEAIPSISGEIWASIQIAMPELLDD